MFIPDPNPGDKVVRLMARATCQGALMSVRKGASSSEERQPRAMTHACRVGISAPCVDTTCCVYPVVRICRLPGLELGVGSTSLTASEPRVEDKGPPADDRDVMP